MSAPVWTIRELAALGDGIDDIDVETDEVRVRHFTRFVRKIRPDTCFIDMILEGESHPDPDVIARAAPAAVLTPRSNEYSGLGVLALKSDDCLTTLGRWAKAHRSRYCLPVAAVTGSVGKTTTTEMLAEILRVDGVVLSTEDNENDELGVPLTLLSLRQCHTHVVLEMGAWRAGEIAFLSNTAVPIVGSITNIGWSHVSRFGSKDLIAEAKGELASAIPVDGALVLDADDPSVVVLAQRVKGRVAYISRNDTGSEAFIESEILRHDRSFVRVRLNGDEVQFCVPMPGKHNVDNAVRSALMANLLHVSANQIVSGIEGFRQRVTGRLTRIPCDGDIFVVDDGYNASPTSVAAAARFLGLHDGRRRVVVFGGMAELGSMSKQLHEIACGQLREKCELFIMVLEFLHPTEISLGRPAFGQRALVAVPSHEACLELLRASIHGGEVVLFKGSRASRMSELAMSYVKSLEEVG